MVTEVFMGAALAVCIVIAWSREARWTGEVNGLRMVIAKLEGQAVRRDQEAERAVAGLEAMLEYQREQMVGMREVIAEKDGAILTMKREGFLMPVPVEAAEVKPSLDMTLDPKVRSRIQDLAGADVRLYWQMVEDSDRLIDAGLTPDEVVEKLTAGSSVNPHHL